MPRIIIPPSTRDVAGKSRGIDRAGPQPQYDPVAIGISKEIRITSYFYLKAIRLGPGPPPAVGPARAARASLRRARSVSSDHVHFGGSTSGGPRPAAS